MISTREAVRRAIVRIRRDKWSIVVAALLLGAEFPLVRACFGQRAVEEQLRQVEPRLWVFRWEPRGVAMVGFIG